MAVPRLWRVRKGEKVTIKRIIERAKKAGRIKDGLVLCDNCDNPADRELSQKLSWTACAPFVFGEDDVFDYLCLIHVHGKAVPRG